MEAIANAWLWAALALIVLFAAGWVFAGRYWRSESQEFSASEPEDRTEVTLREGASDPQHRRFVEWKRRKRDH